MKKCIPPILLLLLWSAWVPAQVNDYSVRALPQLIENDIDKIWAGDLDQYGHLIFSVTESDNPAGLYEYVSDLASLANDSLAQLLNLPGIADLVAYQSEYGDNHRIIYFIQWVPGTGQSILYRFVSPDRLRPHLLFQNLMYGLAVTNVLNSGDIVVWGNKTEGELYDNLGELTGYTRNGIIHGLLNTEDPAYPYGEYLAWTKDVGIIPGKQYCAIYINNDFGKLIGGFGPANGDGYATRLLCTSGTSAQLDELPQPIEAEYTWMGTVPYQGPEEGTMRFMAAGWVNTPNGYEYQLLIWNSDLSDYSVYQNFGLEFPGQFKLHTYAVDEDGNDVLVLAGENVDLSQMGYPNNYSGIILMNSENWMPLEEATGNPFLFTNNGTVLPDFRVLEYNKETGELWCAGKEITGKDDEGNEIQAGFIVLIEEIDGMIFPQGSVSASDLATDDPLIYPNPTAGMITIEGLEDCEGFRIYDLNGRLLRAVDVQLQDSYDLNMADLSDGIYLLQIRLKDRIVPVTVIKATR